MQREVNCTKLKGSQYTHIIKNDNIKKAKEQEMYTLWQNKKWSIQALEKRFLISRREIDMIVW